MAETVAEFFAGRPDSRAVFDILAQRIQALGPVDIEVKTQISFGSKRKFAWFWLYNVTGKNPDGIPHLMLALDHAEDDSHIRDVTRIGKRRWNHQIVVRTLDDARAERLAGRPDDTGLRLRERLRRG